MASSNFTPWAPSDDNNMTHYRLLQLYGDMNQVVYLSQCSIEGVDANFGIYGFTALSTLRDQVAIQERKFVHFRLVQVIHGPHAEEAFQQFRNLPFIHRRLVD